ncbi:translationally-controlled tumor protein homolog [Gigantopelta aegis]|uniref:translationally-controlled tumor protein homolog n=1 Tax=Gigantopelta aegis TaxID=1735272 RepID=UPI001B88A52D|nr:translationally-controlled tumor protein homolog [Gigantopelta aegis]
MIIYKDAVTGDELFSDTYPMKLIHDCIFEVQGKYTTEKTTVSDDMFGGNASAEGGDDTADGDITKSGIDIIIANRLVDVPFSKKQYQKYIKEYMKEICTRLEESNPDRVAQFKKQAAGAVKSILENWDKREYQFWVGESYNVDQGHVALMYYPEDGDGLSPILLFFKDGLKEEKV